VTGRENGAHAAIPAASGALLQQKAEPTGRSLARRNQECEKKPALPAKSRSK